MLHLLVVNFKRISNGRALPLLSAAGRRFFMRFSRPGGRTDYLSRAQTPEKTAIAEGAGGGGGNKGGPPRARAIRSRASLCASPTSRRQL
jgi:hypothetical protein